MKYWILPLVFLVSGSLMGQSDDPIFGGTKEMSTDVYGMFFNRLRVDYNYRYKAHVAFSAGLRTRGQLANVEVNDIVGAPFASRSKPIDDALRFLDARAGLRWYLGGFQDRGVWIETSAIVSLANWQSREYKDEREASLYPDEFRDPKTSFGLEAAAGYRYVFKSGLSLSAHVTGTQLLIRNTFVGDRILPELRENEYLDFRLSASLLTVGYVW